LLPPRQRWQEKNVPLSKTISQVSPSELAATSKTLHRLAEAPGQDRTGGKVDDVLVKDRHIKKQTRRQLAPN
jgi:hypothetical protein